MIAIKDFKMPKCCFECTFCIPNSLCLCKVGHFHFDRKKIYTKKRHENCPLVNIKENINFVSKNKRVKEIQFKLNKIERIVNEVRIDKTITKALAFNKIKEVIKNE